MVSINPMSRARELSYLLKDSGRDGAGLASRRSTTRSRGRSCPTPTCGWCSPPASWSSRPATTSGCSRASSRQRHEGTTDFSEFIAEHRGAGAAAGRARAGRRRVPDLHVGHDRRAQGRDEHPPERRVHRAGLPGLGARRPGRRDLRHRPAVPHHRADRAHRGEHAGAGAAGPGLPVRAAGGARRASLEHRPTFTIGAITAFNALLNAPGFTKDHFASFTLGLLRRRGDLPDRGEGVPGGDRASRCTTPTA